MVILYFIWNIALGFVTIAALLSSLMQSQLGIGQSGYVIMLATTWAAGTLFLGLLDLMTHVRRLTKLSVEVSVGRNAPAAGG